MNRSVMIKRFKEMGLGLYESKSYLSLMEKDILTVTEVSKIAGIPRTNAYEALEKLLAKGLCVSRPGNTKRYGASDPASVKDKFLAQMDHAMEIEMANLTKKENEIIGKYKSVKETKLLELSNKEKEILEKYNAAKESKLTELNKKEKEILEENKIAKDNIIQIVEELKPKYLNSRAKENPMDFIEIIKDSQQIHKKFMELVGETKKELLVFTKPPYSVPKEGLEEQSEQQKIMTEKGVMNRSVHEIPREKEEIRYVFDHLVKTDKINDKTRVIKELPMKMAIFDEKIVILPLEDPLSSGTSFTAQIIRHPALAKTLKITFETMWEQAEDYHVLEDLLKKM
jgi:sugar-specific transcriptional regulator TrmB